MHEICEPLRLRPVDKRKETKSGRTRRILHDFEVTHRQPDRKHIAVAHERHARWRRDRSAGVDNDVNRYVDHRLDDARLANLVAAGPYLRHRKCQPQKAIGREIG